MCGHFSCTRNDGPLVFLGTLNDTNCDLLRHVIRQLGLNKEFLAAKRRQKLLGTVSNRWAWMAMEGKFPAVLKTCSSRTITSAGNCQVLSPGDEATKHGMSTTVSWLSKPHLSMTQNVESSRDKGDCLAILNQDWRKQNQRILAFSAAGKCLFGRT